MCWQLVYYSLLAVSILFTAVHWGALITELDELFIQTLYMPATHRIVSCLPLRTH